MPWEKVFRTGIDKEMMKIKCPVFLLPTCHFGFSRDGFESLFNENRRI